LNKSNSFKESDNISKKESSIRDRNPSDASFESEILSHSSCDKDSDHDHEDESSDHHHHHSSHRSKSHDHDESHSKLLDHSTKKKNKCGSKKNKNKDDRSSTHNPNLLRRPKLLIQK